ncbi:acyl carrier protein [Methylacidimicrobium sp. B4]|uniref:acyl carrier protein n=1 Tax=Methylacidimicrobium sp. B4 TaxID=2796139 RepID=UPI001A8FCDCE|nr:acyl carrier protein [Methylacidimicrobium sp. B4]QSR85105.1 acyl carrier protein [Methylacidimicrobium sp. B4]
MTIPIPVTVTMGLAPCCEAMLCIILEEERRDDPGKGDRGFFREKERVGGKVSSRLRHGVFSIYTRPYLWMAAQSVTYDDLRALLVECCLLRIPVERIGEETPFFGPNGIGLDSIDALQLTAELERRYGVTLQDPDMARKVLENLTTLRSWLREQQVGEER